MIQIVLKENEIKEGLVLVSFILVCSCKVTFIIHSDWFKHLILSLVMLPSALLFIYKSSSCCCKMFLIFSPEFEVILLMSVHTNRSYQVHGESRQSPVNPRIHIQAQIFHPAKLETRNTHNYHLWQNVVPFTSFQDCTWHSFHFPHVSKGVIS